MKRVETFTVLNDSEPLGFYVRPPIKVINLETETEHLITKEYDKLSSLSEILNSGGLTNEKTVGSSANSDFNNLCDWLLWLENQPSGKYTLNVGAGTFTGYYQKDIRIMNKEIIIQGATEATSILEVGEPDEAWYFIYFYSCKVTIEDVTIKWPTTLTEVSTYFSFDNSDLRMADCTLRDIHWIYETTSCIILRCDYYQDTDTAYDVVHTIFPNCYFFLKQSTITGGGSDSIYMGGIYAFGSYLWLDTVTLTDLYRDINGYTDVQIYLDTVTTSGATVANIPATPGILNQTGTFLYVGSLSSESENALIKLPTSDPGIAGVVWNNAGAFAISAG